MNSLPSISDIATWYAPANLDLTYGELTLDWINDSDIDALALAAEDILPPGEESFLPFMENRPATFPQRRLEMARFLWSQRHGDKDNLTIALCVRHRATPIGIQSITFKNFAKTHEVATGSWLTSVYQSRGIGTKMRALVLESAFLLGATQARSSAKRANERSLGVSQKLGYLQDGTQFASDGEEVIRLRLTHLRWLEHRPSYLDVASFKGLDALAEFLEVEAPFLDAPTSNPFIY